MIALYEVLKNAVLRKATSASVIIPFIRWSAGLLLCVLTSTVMGEEAGNSESRFVQMSQAEVRAYEVDVMRRIADLALIPPRLNTTPVPEFDYDKLDYGMTIGIERTPKGRLWAAWVAGGDSPDAFMVAATSDDDGASWSKPRLVISGQSATLPCPRSVLVGNLWTDPRGRLWFFFDQSMNMTDGRGGVWTSICENPDDEHPVWSAPQRISNGHVINKPTVLSSGEWVLPAYLLQHWKGRGPFEGIFPELDAERGVNVLVSKDEGKTWTRRAVVPFPNPDWHEAMIVERKDHSLWMLGRTQKGLVETLSTDGGAHWSEPKYTTNIRQPSARFHFRRLASGRILMVKHGDRIDAHDGRVKLGAWLSEDEGATWKGGLVLDGRRGVSYPDGIQAPDGTIYISYDRNRDTDGEILMARFTEEDILAGKLVHPRSKLMMVISRPMKDRIEKDLVLNPNVEGRPFIAGPAAKIEPAKGDEVRSLEKNALIYSNRDYVFYDLPSVLTGRRFIFSPIEHTEAMVREAGMVYVLTPRPIRNPQDNVESELLKQGFEKAAVPETILTLYRGHGRALETVSLYQKQAKAGEKIRFGKFGKLVF